MMSNQRALRLDNLKQNRKLCQNSFVCKKKQQRGFPSCQALTDSVPFNSESVSKEGSWRLHASPQGKQGARFVPLIHEQHMFLLQMKFIDQSCFPCILMTLWVRKIEKSQESEVWNNTSVIAVWAWAQFRVWVWVWVWVVWVWVPEEAFGLGNWIH